MELVDVNPGNVQATIKKKGRPRKVPLLTDLTISEKPESEEVEKKKRGRKKKEKVEEEAKPKKKRGRKAAVKFYSSSIRKKIPLTTIIQDNDKSILHLDIKDQPDKTEDVLFDVAKGEYSGSNPDVILESSQISELRPDKTGQDTQKDELEEYIDNENLMSVQSISDLYEKRLQTRLNQDHLLIENLEKMFGKITRIYWSML